MDIVYNSKVNKKISEILNSFIAEINDQITRDKIAYQIKCFLEKEKIDYETVNLYTEPKTIDEGRVDIRIDDELYPFKEIFAIDEESWFDYCLKWERGDLSDEDVIKLFQYLIDEGHVWNLQEFYKRTAEELIEGGCCTLSYKETTGRYIWGNPKIPTKYELPENAPGTDAYVQKRKELNDSDFFEWATTENNEE